MGPLLPHFSPKFLRPYHNGHQDDHIFIWLPPPHLPTYSGANPHFMVH